MMQTGSWFHEDITYTGNIRVLVYTVSTLNYFGALCFWERVSILSGETKQDNYGALRLSKNFLSV